MAPTSDRRMYSRVYWDVPDDPKFAEVWHDDRALALWLRLLLVADAAYPAAAYLPGRANVAALVRLTEAGIVDRIGKERFRIHGLQPERERRAESARVGGLARWNKDPGERSDSDRSADAMRSDATASDTFARTRRGRGRGREEDEGEEEARVAADLLLDEDDVLDVWYRLTASPPSARVIPWLERLASEYGTDATAQALGVAWSENGDRSTVLSRTQGLLWQRAHEGQKATRRQEAADRRLREAERAAEVASREADLTPERRRENMTRLRDALVGSRLFTEEQAASALPDPPEVAQ